jgi:ribosomal-protein-alanine N-acetyltransferase
MTDHLRLLRTEDAEELTEVLRANREFLAPWEPERDEEFFTPAGQRATIAAKLDAHASGHQVPFVICGPGGEIAGQLNLVGITRGAMQSAGVGYWVRRDLNGLGLATRAATAAVDHAFTALDLHRVEAVTLLHNTASQAVLRKAGFTPYGVVPRYLKIAGSWQDHVQFHVLADA